MAITKNAKVLEFVQESAELGQPDKIVWIDGSEKQINALKAEAANLLNLTKFFCPTAIFTAPR